MGKRVVSGVVDYLERSGEKIEWERSCWKDGVDYEGVELDGERDSDFVSSEYFAWIANREVGLEYNVDWEKGTSCFGIKFSKWANLNLKPKPRDIRMFSGNFVFEKEGACGENPVFQARYFDMFVDGEDAEVAMRDFADNGERLVEYFVGMERESLGRFVGLARKFRDVGGVVRLG